MKNIILKKTDQCYIYIIYIYIDNRYFWRWFLEWVNQLLASEPRRLGLGDSDGERERERGVLISLFFRYVKKRRPALSAPTNLVKNAMFWAFSDMCVQVCKQYVLLPFPAVLRHVLIAAGCLSTVLCHLASEYQKENSILPCCAMLKW